MSGWFRRSWFSRWYGRLGLLLIMVGELLLVFGVGGYYLIEWIQGLGVDEILEYAWWIINHMGEIDTYHGYLILGGVVGGFFFIIGLIALHIAGIRSRHGQK